MYKIQADRSKMMVTAKEVVEAAFPKTKAILYQPFNCRFDGIDFGEVRRRYGSSFDCEGIQISTRDANGKKVFRRVMIEKGGLIDLEKLRLKKIEIEAVRDERLKAEEARLERGNDLQALHDDLEKEVGGLGPVRIVPFDNGEFGVMLTERLYREKAVRLIKAIKEAFADEGE